MNPINYNEIYALVSNESIGDGSIILPKLLVESNELKSNVNNYNFSIKILRFFFFFK